ncbi:MAG: AI-2E family transporter [Actinobacteria bacterium]|nr:AI-2E family transporter [Actinomycetota bacterium]
MSTLVRHEPKDRWLRVLIVTWSMVGMCLIVAGAGWVLGKVSAALAPFLLAVVVVLLLRSPVAALERRGVKRGLAVGLCYLVGLAVMGIALGFLVPVLVDQVRQFVLAFPGYYDKASTLLLQMQDKYQALVVPPWVEDALANLQDTITKQSATWSKALASKVFSAGGSAITLLGYGVMSLVVAFWTLKDLPTMNREALLLAGPHREEEMRVVMEKVSRILNGYVKGQGLLSLSTGAIVAIGLTILGVPYSLVIGLLAALLNIIPWVGPALTTVIAGIAAAFVSPLHILGAVLVCVGAQQITEIFVQPRVMSDQVDLHPLLVIFSLLVGGSVFGFTGLVLAIPVAAVGKGLFVYYFEKYTDSKLATEGGALFRASTGAQCEDATDLEGEPRRDATAQVTVVNDDSEENARK